MHETRWTIVVLAVDAIFGRFEGLSGVKDAINYERNYCCRGIEKCTIKTVRNEVVDWPTVSK